VWCVIRCSRLQVGHGVFNVFLRWKSTAGQINVWNPSFPTFAVYVYYSSCLLGAASYFPLFSVFSRKGGQSTCRQGKASSNALLGIAIASEQSNSGLGIIWQLNMSLNWIDCFSDYPLCLLQKNSRVLSGNWDSALNTWKSYSSCSYPYFAGMAMFFTKHICVEHGPSLERKISRKSQKILCNNSVTNY
jgi:hypothetical protein